MNLLRRPWAQMFIDSEKEILGPDDCFLADANIDTKTKLRFAPLIKYGERQLRQFPYPKSGHSETPIRAAGLPSRPKIGLDSKPNEELDAHEAFSRMHHVLARVEELEAALDNPEFLWDRLQAAWLKAEDESNPRMAEIVRQASHVLPHLIDLEKRIRKILRRDRELTPLDRVQEMDRTSMLWMARQPGRTTAERAGAGQRIMAIVRHEDFNTLENRVLHAYVKLAAQFSRQWLREHKRANSSQRYHVVASYFRLCRRISRELSELGVAVAEAGITVNYVLMEDRAYHKVKEGWDRLLRQDNAEDELWAWQAQSWTDFCVLALTISLHALKESELVTQAPLIWLDESELGRRFLHDRPLAVFWLKETELIVEIQARPETPTKSQFLSRAHVWLKVFDLTSTAFERRVPVWTPHCFNRMSPETEAASAANIIETLRQTNVREVIREGLILMPAHGNPESVGAENNGCRVQAIALDAVGDPLAKGMCSLTSFIRTCVQVGSE